MFGTFRASFGAIRTFVEYASEQQKEKYLPDLLAGKKILGLGMSEPEAGSAPLLPVERRAPVLGRDDQSADNQFDVMTEEQLLHETGRHVENPTMSVSSRYVFDHCQKPVDLIGPVVEVAASVAFWLALPYSPPRLRRRHNFSPADLPQRPRLLPRRH